MKNLEEQLNELLAQSDRVAAELNREIFLIGRADAAITYLRAVREQTAMQVAALLEQRTVSTLPPLNPPAPRGASGPSAAKGANGASGFGSYDPNWPQ